MWYPHHLGIDSGGGISTDFFFQTTNYPYQKNNSGIEKIYIRFNQDILDIFGFTELNIKHSTIDFFITLQETPTKPKYSIMMGQKNSPFSYTMHFTSVFVS